LGHKQPQEITPLEVDRLRLRIMKDKSPQTVKLTLALLRRLKNFGGKRHLCLSLSFPLEMPKVNNLKTEDQTPGQLANLLAVLDQATDIQAANFLRLALVSGMWRGELLNLKWEDLDFEKGFIHIRNPKSGKDAVIPMNQEARNVLETHPRDPNSPYVFPGKNGNRRSEFRRPINRIRQRSGLPPDFRPLHGLRHTYASMLASSGQVDLYTLRKLLTHRSPTMTQRYAHLRDEALRRAAELAGPTLLCRCQ